MAVRGRCSIVTCMRVRWVSHTRKYTQWNIFLFESSDKSPYWTNPYHIGFRCEASLNFHTYFGQCPNDTYILLHFPLYVCSNYPHTGLTTATAPSGHQMAVVTCDRSIGTNFIEIRNKMQKFRASTGQVTLVAIIGTTKLGHFELLFAKWWPFCQGLILLKALQ